MLLYIMQGYFLVQSVLKGHLNFRAVSLASLRMLLLFKHGSHGRISEGSVSVLLSVDTGHVHTPHCVHLETLGPNCFIYSTYDELLRTMMMMDRTLVAEFFPPQSIHNGQAVNQLSTRNYGYATIQR